jgi:hypothetical protein
MIPIPMGNLEEVSNHEEIEKRRVVEKAENRKMGASEGSELSSSRQETGCKQAS